VLVQNYSQPDPLFVEQQSSHARLSWGYSLEPLAAQKRRIVYCAMGFLAKFFFFSLGISNLAKAEYDATDALREFMRTQDPGTTHSTTVQSLRGATFDIDNDLRDALRSARLSTVQAAMEHALNAKPGEFDEKLFNDVKRWYNELDKRMGLLKYCNRIRGQGWDGECLGVENWWNSVKYKEFMDRPWKAH